MANRQIEERARIRAARYAPGGRYDEAIERTLKDLPGRKRGTLKNRGLAASSAAAALALLLAFTAPQIVRAAAQLYQRLFGQVVADIEAEQAQPEDEKLKALIADSEGWSRSHKVEGASAQIGDVTLSVASVRTMPVDKYNKGTKGELDLTLTYSKIPPFDPSRVDFSLVVDGREIPMRIDEQFKAYRDEDGHTLTEAEWADEWTGSNSQLWGGVPTTWLWFDVDDWQWDQPRKLELKAVIDGKQLLIPFAFDPAKAHAQAAKSAKESMMLLEENYLHEKDELESMEANAVPVGLTGSAYGYDWAISEMSYAQDKLYFTAAFGGVREKNPKMAAMSFWANNVTVDGMMVSLGSSDSDELKGGNYTAVYQYPLGRDPHNLPEQSIISISLELGDPGKRKDVAFKYSWKEKTVALPKDEAEMQLWVDQARQMHEKLYGRYPKDVGYDLTPLNLTREKDGVSMTITGANFCSYVNRLEFHVKFEGDLAGSSHTWDWSGAPDVTINGHRCYGDGGSHEGGALTKFYVRPPLNISEFGNGDVVVFNLRLYDKNGDYEHTNYPEPVDVLTYEFTIDKAALEPLKADN